MLSIRLSKRKEKLMKVSVLTPDSQVRLQEAIDSSPLFPGMTIEELLDRAIEVVLEPEGTILL